MNLAKWRLLGRFAWLYSISLVIPTAYFEPRLAALLKEWEAMHPPAGEPLPPSP